MERTLVLIKPDGVDRNLIGEIIKRFENGGLKVRDMKMVAPKKEFVEIHYAMHKGKPFFDLLIKYLANRQVVAMVLEGKDAVALVRKIVGTTDPSKADKGTIRGDLGNDSREKADAEHRSIYNVIHASGTPEEAKVELKLWFGK
ncbi:MAG: nucleoside-diphosphate kinase [Candidatus Aenigmarchaeota archaeon]|nr:nucleoside-diphosphate kinase [Candidatus Aenigmarchaeota archaeon]